MENRASPAPWVFSLACSQEQSCQEGSPLGALEWVEGFLRPDSAVLGWIPGSWLGEGIPIC